MKNRLTILFILALSISFGQNEDSLLLKLESIDIETFEKNEDKKEYLELVFNLDQAIRESYDKIHLEFGRESKEFFSIIKKWREVDSILLSSMIKYLETYSYPKKELGELACYTPQLIFHHTSGTVKELELKRRFFPTFYSAYKETAIDEGAMYFYLYRLYGQVFKEEYSSDLGQEEQIMDLINKLNI